MKTYVIVGEHKDYRLGAVVQFLDEDAEKLVKAGIAKLEAEPQPTKKSAQKTDIDSAPAK